MISTKVEEPAMFIPAKPEPAAAEVAEATEVEVAETPEELPTLPRPDRPSDARRSRARERRLGAGPVLDGLAVGVVRRPVPAARRARA
jgi:hypothetical protein